MDTIDATHLALRIYNSAINDLEAFVRHMARENADPGNSSTLDHFRAAVQAHAWLTDERHDPGGICVRDAYEKSRNLRKLTQETLAICEPILGYAIVGDWDRAGEVARVNKKSSTGD